MRDQQMRDEREKKGQEKRMLFESESNELGVIQKEIKEEKQKQLQKKLKEREQSRKVIEENELAKKKYMKVKHVEKERDTKALEEYEEMLEAQDAKRKSQIAIREERTKKIMNRLGDSVVKDQKTKVNNEFGIIKKNEQLINQREEMREKLQKNSQQNKIKEMKVQLNF